MASQKAMKARFSPKSGLNQKKVAFLQGGRLKTILIPILATASQLEVPQHKTCSSAFNNATKEFSTTSRFLDASKMDHDRQWDLILNEDQPSLVTLEIPSEMGSMEEKEEEKEQLSESLETGDDARAPGGLKNQSATNDLKQRKTEVELFINTLLHTLQCNSSTCNMDGCKKMSRVLGHFLMCLKKRTNLLGGPPTSGGQNGPMVKESSCTLCAQLLDIVTEHAKQPHPQQGVGTKCSVPMCDALRRIGESKESGSAKNGSALSAFMPGEEGLISG